MMVQVNEDAEYLQGSMRFLGSLFREHHLPYAFIRTLVTDLTSHSEKVHQLISPMSSKYHALLHRGPQ